MDRRSFLRGSLAAAAAATAAGGTLGLVRFFDSDGGKTSEPRTYGSLELRRRRPASDAPNVLMLALDDCNDWLGFLNNHPGTYTPNLDALAAQSVVFTHAYTPAPMCLPARTAVMFGRHPFDTAIYDHTDPSQQRYRRFSGVTPSLVDEMWAAGYDAVGAGKIFNGAETARWAEYRTTEHYYDGWLRKNPDTPAYAHDPDWLSPYDGRPIGRGERFTAAMTDFGPSGRAPADEPDGEAAEWVRRHLRQPRRAPLFLAFGCFLPHVPWRVPQRFLDLHPLEQVVVPEFRPDDLDDLSAYARTEIIPKPTRAFELLQTSGLWEEAVQAYQAAISFVDDRVGQVLNELADGPLADDTIIVLWSDHGYHLGEKLHLHKFTLWERATRVPFLLHVPGRFDREARFDPPVSTIDLAPTLAELCGLEQRSPHAGESLLPLLKDPALADARPPICTWLAGNHAVRRGPWRYIRYNTGDIELYDHRDDPHEYVNLAGRPEHAAVEGELASFLPAPNSGA
jgi:arylsulfatase A-like enzyme